jgi:hypothetical protein
MSDADRKAASAWFERGAVKVVRTLMVGCPLKRSIATRTTSRALRGHSAMTKGNVAARSRSVPEIACPFNEALFAGTSAESTVPQAHQNPFIIEPRTNPVAIRNGDEHSWVVDVVLTSSSTRQPHT